MTKVLKRHEGGTGVIKMFRAKTTRRVTQVGASYGNSGGWEPVIKRGRERLGAEGSGGRGKIISQKMEGERKEKLQGVGGRTLVIHKMSHAQSSAGRHCKKKGSRTKRRQSGRKRDR